MKKLAIVFSLLCVSMICTGKKDAEYWRMVRNGVSAKIAVHVVDGGCVPLQNADVRVVFSRFADEYTICGKTDTNGVCIVESKTCGNKVKMYINKEGYYNSQRELSFIRMGKELDVKDGKWQPYPMDETVVLRKMKKPVKMVVEEFYRYSPTEIINTWIGFDIERNDFVAPHGKGRECDFEIYIDWNGRWLPEYSGMKIKIRFPGPYSGYYCCQKNRESDFKWPYNANPFAEYLKTACFGESVCPDGSRKEYYFDKSKCWIVRSRCRLDENGKLIGANYSVVSGIGMACKKGGIACFGVIGAFNPVLNDMNLEPKR